MKICQMLPLYGSSAAYLLRFKQLNCIAFGTKFDYAFEIDYHYSA